MGDCNRKRNKRQAVFRLLVSAEKQDMGQVWIRLTCPGVVSSPCAKLLLRLLRYARPLRLSSSVPSRSHRQLNSLPHMVFVRSSQQRHNLNIHTYMFLNGKGLRESLWTKKLGIRSPLELGRRVPHGGNIRLPSALTQT